MYISNLREESGSKHCFSRWVGLFLLAIGLIFTPAILTPSYAADKTDSHFILHWDQGVTADNAPTYQKELKPFYDEALKELKKTNPGKSDQELRPAMCMNGYAKFIQKSLDDIASKYTAKSFMLPSKKLDVYIVNAEQDAVYRPIDPTIAAASITIGSKNYALGELKHDIAHEMFHWIQNGSYTMYEMDDSRWLMDMTADFAPKAMIDPNDKYTGEYIRQDFLKNPLTYDPSITDRHKYHAAKFLEDMSKRMGKFNFRLFYMDLVTGPRNDALASLENAASNKGGKGLLYYYRAFAGKLLFAQDSPTYFEGEAETNARLQDPATNGLAIADRLQGNKKSIDMTLVVGANYCAGVWAVNVDMPDAKTKSRALKLETKDAMGLSTAVDVYKTKSSYRNAVRVGEIVSGGKSLLLNISAGERLYVVATNGNRDDASFNLKLTDMSLKLEVTPTVTKDAMVGKAVIITSKVTGPTDAIENLKFIYEFGDGSKYEGGTGLMNGFTTHSKGHAYTKLGKYQGKVTVYSQRGSTPLATATFQVSVTKKAPATTPKPQTPSTTPATGSSTVKAEYAWILTETIEFNKVLDNDPKYSINGGSGGYTLGYQANGCYVQDCTGEDFKAVFSWNPPPARINADDRVNMTLGLNVTSNMHHYSYSGNITAFFDNPDINPGFYGGGGPGLVDASGKGGIDFNVSSGSFSSTRKVSAVLGKGTIGSKKALIVALYNGRTAGTKYIYEWRKVN